MTEPWLHVRRMYPGSGGVSVSVKGARFPARPQREPGIWEQMGMTELGAPVSTRGRALPWCDDLEGQDHSDALDQKSGNSHGRNHSECSLTANEV